MLKLNTFFAYLLIGLAFATPVNNLAIAGEKKIPLSPGKKVQMTFKDGANCLFIGHSFFIPVARYFDKVARRNGFSSHQTHLVFAPGKLGSPKELWNNSNRRTQIEGKLANGKIDLLGMTAGFKSSFEDYQQWIDLSLKYNPKTRFFIGQCWMLGGPRMENKKYNLVIEASGNRLFQVVSKLRKTYPKNHIYFINYGKMASEMKYRFNAKQLPDITKMVGPDKKGLFRDGFIGHGGPMMLELSSLIWLNTLYGAEIEKLKYTPYQSNVKDITTKVLKYNLKYR